MRQTVSREIRWWLWCNFFCSVFFSKEILFVCHTNSSVLFPIFFGSRYCASSEDWEMFDKCSLWVIYRYLTFVHWSFKFAIAGNVLKYLFAFFHARLCLYLSSNAHCLLFSHMFSLFYNIQLNQWRINGRALHQSSITTFALYIVSSTLAIFITFVVTLTFFQKIFASSISACSFAPTCCVVLSGLRT